MDFPFIHRSHITTTSPGTIPPSSTLHCTLPHHPHKMGDDDSNNNSSSSNTDSSSLSRVVQSLFNLDGNIMLAAIISLLLVIVFVLILHIYAKWFLAQARHRRRTSTSRRLPPDALFLDSPHFQSQLMITTTLSPSPSPSKGLDASIISAIPLFVYTPSSDDKPIVVLLECVICLSPFEEADIGRKLPQCGHEFHVECIDMWLHSHTNCPICRASVAPVIDKKGTNDSDPQIGIRSEEDAPPRGSGPGPNETANLHEIIMIEAVNININGDQQNNVMAEARNSDSHLSSSSSSSSSSILGHSFMRMLSRNRSESNKIHPSLSPTSSECDIMVA